jgi:hypothetical protein
MEIYSISMAVAGFGHEAWSSIETEVEQREKEKR